MQVVKIINSLLNFNNIKANLNFLSYTMSPILAKFLIIMLQSN